MNIHAVQFNSMNHGLCAITELHALLIAHNNYTHVHGCTDLRMPCFAYCMNDTPFYGPPVPDKRWNALHYNTCGTTNNQGIGWLPNSNYHYTKPNPSDYKPTFGRVETELNNNFHHQQAVLCTTTDLPACSTDWSFHIIIATQTVQLAVLLTTSLSELFAKKKKATQQV